MRVGLFADSHLADSIWANVPESAGVPGEAFGLLCGSMRERRVDMAAGAGDIFDSRKLSSGPVLTFMRGMDVLNVVSVFTQGTHDYNQESWVLIHGNCRAVSGVARAPEAQGLPEAPQWKSIRVFGMDAVKRSEGVKDALAAIPMDTRLAMLHLPFRHLLGFEGAWQAELGDLPPLEGAIVLCGDIHTRHISDFGTRSKFVSPGSTHPRRILEVPLWKESEGAHGWVLWDTDTNELEPVDIPSLVVRAEGLEDTRDAVAALRGGPTRLVCSRVPPEQSEEARALGGSHLPVAVFHVVAARDGEARTGAVEPVETGAATLMDALDMVVDKNKEPELYDLLSSDLAARGGGR